MNLKFNSGPVNYRNYQFLQFAQVRTIYQEHLPKQLFVNMFNICSYNKYCITNNNINSIVMSIVNSNQWDFVPYRCEVPFYIFTNQNSLYTKPLAII